MAFTLQAPLKEIDVGKGQTGERRFSGIGAFSTTDTTGSFDCPIKNITGITLTPIGTPAAAETLSIDAASVATNGVIARASGGVLNIARVGANVTSGLKVAIELKGY